MAYPWWSMTQHGRRLNKDSTLVFLLWIQVVLFFVTSGGVSAETEIPHITRYTEVGNITRINPCLQCWPSRLDKIDRVTYGIGTSPGRSSVIIARNKTHVTSNKKEHFDMDEKFRLVIQKTLRNDSGNYWCQVTPVGRLSCKCLITLKLLNVTPNVTSDEPAYRQITTTPRASQPTPAAQKGSPSSEAAPMFTSSTFTMALCLVSGILTIWRGFLPLRLTT